MNSADIVIVGGGIWGLSTAYHLARQHAGGSIVLLERNVDLAVETTKQAAGQIGQLRSNRVMAQGVGYTLELLQKFQSETGYDPGFHQPGSLHLALNDLRLTALHTQLSRAPDLGIDVRAISKEAIRELAPTIDLSQITGAIHLPQDGYVNARQCALAFAKAAQDAEVSIRCGVEVLGFDVVDQALTAVRTSEGTIHTRVAVITAGPWCGVLAAQAGCSAPMQPIRLQQARTVEDPLFADQHPVVRIPDLSCYLRPEQRGYLFGVFDPEPLAIDLQRQPPSFRTDQIPPPVDVIDQAKRDLTPIFPVLSQLSTQQYRQGMVTCTPDGEYILGPLPEVTGMWIATGCGAMGIAGSAPVGRWLSRWILSGEPGDDLDAFRPDRFGKQGQSQEWVERKSRETCANYYSLTQGKTYTAIS